MTQTALMGFTPAEPLSSFHPIVTLAPTIWHHPVKLSPNKGKRKERIATPFTLQWTFNLQILHTDAMLSCQQWWYVLRVSNIELQLIRLKVILSLAAWFAIVQLHSNSYSRWLSIWQELQYLYNKQRIKLCSILLIIHHKTTQYQLTRFCQVVTKTVPIPFFSTSEII